MALPLYAFTTFNGTDFALVGQSAGDDTLEALRERAKETIYTLAAGVPPAVENVLVSRLKVVTHADAYREPYQAYLNTPFDLGWVEAQLDAAS